MKHLLILLTFTAMTFSLFRCSTKNSSLKTVPSVDLSRYSGKWYEIASFPQSFQKGCHNTSAEYTLSPKGYVIVENRCNKGSINGKESYIKGKAFVVENSNNAKLKVQFFWPFKGDYWILDLAEDYSYAVVGSPDKNYLWILSRTSSIDPSVYANITNRLSSQRFDVNRLQKTTHGE